MGTRDPHHPPAVGVILAGGGATRYGGRAKGLGRVGGVRILDRLVAAFEEAFGAPPLLVANDPGAPAWHPGLRVVADVQPGYGALGGIHTAVVAGPAPVVVVAWDMPFVPAALIRRLAGGLVAHDAVLPASGGRRGLEPLCAAYGPACRAPIAACMAAGDYRAIAFHDAVRVGILSVTEMRDLGPPERLFFNVNTPEDLLRANQP